MGNKSQGSRVANQEGTTAVLADGLRGEDALWEEKVEVSSCCGVTTERVRRSTTVAIQDASSGKTSLWRIAALSLRTSPGPTA
jgi:hypothetical protein